MKTMCLTTCSNIFFNMFRMTQNGSKLIQRVKKAKNAPIFSKHAEEILTLFDLTHLCTNFVLVPPQTQSFKKLVSWNHFTKAPLWSKALQLRNIAIFCSIRDRELIISPDRLGRGGGLSKNDSSGANISDICQYPN